jgi:hypothetical protein
MHNKTVVGLVIGGILILWFVWAFFAWGKPSDFRVQASPEAIKLLLAQRGLETCSESTLGFSNTPGFVRGKSITVSTMCTTDLNPMRVSLLQFDSEASRNGAVQRAATTHRNGFGPHTVYAYGPYVLTVQGTRGISDQLLLGEALSEAGAHL